MNDRLEFGFVVTGEHWPVDVLESLPIDSLWVGGHIASRNPSPEPMMQLARLAALTRRVRIGTGVLLAPLYPPAIIAKQIADLDRTTGGRIILGIGAGGEYPGEFRACEVPLEQRGPRTNETIELLRLFWSANEVSYAGRFFDIRDVRIHPAPAQPGGPPIIVGGRSDAAMRRAARLGDGWMPYLVSPRQYAASVQKVRDFAEGRVLDSFGWYSYVFINVGDDGDEARRETARFLGATYAQDFNPLVEKVTASGTESEVADKLQQYVDAGARHLVFLPCAHDGAAMTQRIMESVVPRLAPLAPGS